VLAGKNESGTCSAVAVVEATAMQSQRQLWQTTGGGGGIVAALTMALAKSC
jgi:hypothetical protein